MPHDWHQSSLECCRLIWFMILEATRKHGSEEGCMVTPIIEYLSIEVISREKSAAIIVSHNFSHFPTSIYRWETNRCLDIFLLHPVYWTKAARILINCTCWAINICHQILKCMWVKIKKDYLKGELFPFEVN